MIKKNYIIYFVFIGYFVTILLSFNICSTIQSVYALSPSFSLQQIQDDSNDWINMNSKQLVTSKHHFNFDNIKMGIADIRQVSYFSDGQFLNATLWTSFPFNEKPKEFEQVNYGMMIDSDFDRNTGYGGIDYLYQIGWNNNTKTWNKMLWELSSTGEQKTLLNQKNTTDFFEKQKAYVVLPLNLRYLQYPQKYMVTFYAEVKRNEKEGFITDFTRTVAIPPLKLGISVIPPIVSLRPGTTTNIGLQINSTSGFEPTVYLSTSTDTRDLTTLIKYNKIRIPSYGVATIPMTIISSPYASSRIYTIFILANSTFPPENQIIKEFFHFSPSQLPSQSSNSPIPRIDEMSQNVLGQSTILVTVLDPLSWQDQINEFWGKMGNFIQFFYGLIIGISPLIFNKLKNKIKKTNE